MSSRMPRGISLIDVLVGTAITLIIFLALFGLLRASLMVSSLAKSRSIATAIATSNMEYIRSLPYDSIGTVGGIPAGIVAETSTTTENGLSFGVRTFIQYVDDPKDGLGAADETGIITDYKRIRVTVSYTINGTLRELALISNQAPPGIETTTGGGTLQISVVNAVGAGVPGATVTIENPSLSPAVDVTAFSNASGIVYLPGAATSTDYRVTVTKSGYSTAQTYARDATNQNPTPGYLTVAKDQTTTGTFAIDLLSSFTIRTYSPISTDTWTDSFSDTSKLASQSTTNVSGGSLVLSQTAGAYSSSGSARSTAVAPQYLASWTQVLATTTEPAGAARVQVADASGAVLPEAVVPGNSAGFATFPIDLSLVSTSTYPSLTLIANLSTTDPLQTPQVTEWSIRYMAGPTPLPNVAFTLSGAKTIGSTGAGAGILKTTVSDTTGSGASKALSLEWDSYQLTIGSYDVVDACAAPPYSLSAGTTTTASLMLDTRTTNALLLTVRDAAGALVTDADVTLARSGYSSTVKSSSCGTAYFGGLTNANDYTVTLTKSGYDTTVVPSVNVSGHTFYAASFE